MSDTELEEILEDVPPSAKLVYRVLEHEGELTQKEIVTESRLEPRTARYAISRLEEDDLITSRPSPTDARQTLYSVVKRK